MTGNLCYIGHDHRADLSALHVAFGRVACCASHHPDRGTRGLPFGSLDAPVAAPAPRPATPPPAGGPRVLKTTPPVTRPPAGFAQVSPEVARQRVAAHRASVIAAAAARNGGAL